MYRPFHAVAGGYRAPVNRSSFGIMTNAGDEPCSYHGLIGVSDRVRVRQHEPGDGESNRPAYQ